LAQGSQLSLDIGRHRILVWTRAGGTAGKESQKVAAQVWRHAGEVISVESIAAASTIASWASTE